jgi:hypothetical protein
LLLKCKNQREIEQLISDNDVLQNKLHVQEHDFRLQNQTLMGELSVIMKKNEQYEAELKSFRQNSDLKSLGT